MTKSSAWPTETMKKARKQRTFQVVSRVSKLAFFTRGQGRDGSTFSQRVNFTNQITTWDKTFK